MFDELYPRERVASLSQSVQRPMAPPDAPGAFSGMGSAIADAFPHAGLTAVSAWGAMLNSVQRTAVGAAAKLLPTPLAGGEINPDSLIGPPMVETEKARQIAKDYTPDPASVGMAGQIAHGVLSSLTKAGAYALATGPAAPVAFGADLGINRAQELTDKGVDDESAALAGVVTGVTSAVGMRLPAAMGSSRLQSAAIGATVNPALNVVEIGGIHALLSAADYESIAAQYQPFDPVNLAVAAVTGGAFGAGFYRNKPTANAPRLTSDEHAAALTMHETRVRDADTLVRPVDIEAAGAAREAQILARHQIDSGEPVSVAHQVPADPAQLAAKMQRVTDAPVMEAFTEASTPPPPEMGSPVPELPARVAQQADTALPAPVQRIVDSVSRLFGDDAPVGQTRKADTPEQARAFEIAARDPDVMIRTDEGDARVSDLLKAVDDLEDRARTDSKAFDAAIECALRFPQ